ncbi:MAG TPA: SEC-C domain-containing protein [Deferrisomatales bacterium]|nr:SEC-C domain-containing protein [Deferrisomatales bacterium]
MTEFPTPSPRYHSLSDRDLLDLLYTAGDRLPREAVDEMLRRRERTAPELCAVVMDKANWTQPLPEWWAAVHATYLVAAMEDPALLVCLLSALRWADAFDCDWVTEDLPSMFGRLGPATYPALSAIVADITAGPGARAVALAGAAAAALGDPRLLDEILDTAAAIAGNDAESLFLRQSAANLLLDFRATRHSALLQAFGREEAARRKDDPEYQGVFYDWEVDELLQEEAGQNLEYYRRDWMVFYDPEEMERREERWRREQEEGEDTEAHTPTAPQRDLQAPCSCGSGRPFEHCCYLRVH